METNRISKFIKNMKTQILFLAFLFSSIFSFGQANTTNFKGDVNINGSTNGTSTQWTDVTVGATQTRIGVNNLPSSISKFS